AGGIAYCVFRIAYPAKTGPPLTLSDTEYAIRNMPYLFPHGSSTDLYQSIVPETLACWMAPAGSTCFGQTTEHWPTKVHSQTPSLLETIWARSSVAPSRESRLYRCASAIAAGPTNAGSRP